MTTYNNLLSLDLSTSCTGFAIFNPSTKELLSKGHIKPKVKGVTKMKYPVKQINVMLDMTAKICELVDTMKPQLIVIEEIAGSKNRITQKILDGVHWILLRELQLRGLLDRVIYYDVSGAEGWRRHIDLRMTDADRKHNKEAMKLNKDLAKGTTKIPKVDTKTLSCRYANHFYNLNLDAGERTSDGDEADAICMGHAYIHKVL